MNIKRVDTKATELRSFDVIDWSAVSCRVIFQNPRLCHKRCGVNEKTPLDTWVVGKLKQVAWFESKPSSWPRLQFFPRVPSCSIITGSINMGLVEGFTWTARKLDVLWHWMSSFFVAHFRQSSFQVQDSRYSDLLTTSPPILSIHRTFAHFILRREKIVFAFSPQQGKIRPFKFWGSTVLT